jgi:hypothetical protein
VVGQGRLRGPRVGVGVAVFGAAFAGALVDEAAAVARRIKVGQLLCDGRLFELLKHCSGLGECIGALIVEEDGGDEGGVQGRTEFFLQGVLLVILCNRSHMPCLPLECGGFHPFLFL